MIRAQNQLLRDTLNGECARSGRLMMICDGLYNVYMFTLGRLQFVWESYLQVCEERDYLLARNRDLESQLARASRSPDQGA